MDIAAFSTTSTKKQGTGERPSGSLITIFRFLILFVLVLTLLALFFLTVQAEGSGTEGSRTITVGHDESANHSTLQAAVDNATDGDVILVGKGVYGDVLVNKSLDLKGSGVNQTQVGHIKIVGANITIQRLTVQGNGSLDTGIYLEEVERAVIRNCTVLDCRWGISNPWSWTRSPPSGGAYMEVVDCQFLRCGFGIVESHLCTSRIINCTLESCSFGVELHGDGDLVSGCLFADNVYGVVSDYQRSWIKDNSFRNNSIAIYGGRGQLILKGNSFVGNEKNVHSEFTTPEELTLLELGKLCGSFCVSSIVIILTPLVLFIRRTPRQRENEVIGTDRISSQIMALKETLKSLQEMCLEVTYFFWLIAVVFVWPFILFYGLATGTDTQEELLWVTVFNFVFLSFFVGIPILGHLSTRKIILQELAELYEARERELQRLASL